ncbi:MAG: DNA-binding protein [Clostridia bacterium]|nr:DNA-binding protein [Clostridia bacterium]
MFQKDMKYSLLLDFYGDILSERKREIIELYYNEDLSLAEVSEITGISRQGVRDSVKKTESELMQLEEKLGLAKRFEDIGNQLDVVVETLQNAIESPEISKNEIVKAINIISDINL